ncbi:MAG: AAA family ATPase, partial [Actinomycetota bacterium]|nr:AAA family ATPase [Actinomycetota bacterium]
DEQAEMVRRLTGSGAGVEVVVGKAGTGKTYALDAARAAWQAAGYRVTGAALAARAALELEASAGIDSYTIDRLLADIEHPEHGGLAPESVVVVDEAAMVGTRKLARLLDAAAPATTGAPRPAPHNSERTNRPSGPRLNVATIRTGGGN